MMPGPHRYLRQTPPAGCCGWTRAKIATETKLDGKYLLRCSDPNMSAEDIALGYKQLIQVERGWRDPEDRPLELRPVLPPASRLRIRAHVLLCWLALLLVRIIEDQDREHLDHRPRGTCKKTCTSASLHRPGPGTFTQTSTPTPAARAAPAGHPLGIDPPKKILRLVPAGTPEPARPHSIPGSSLNAW